MEIIILRCITSTWQNKNSVFCGDRGVAAEYYKLREKVIMIIKREDYEEVYKSG